MLPLNLFGSAQFTSANVVTFVVYGALGGALFLLPIQLQQVSGLQPAGGRHLAAAGHRDHAGAVRPVRRARRARSAPGCR